MAPRTHLLACLLASMLVIAACGDDDDTVSPTSTTTTSTTATVTTATVTTTTTPQTTSTASATTSTMATASLAADRVVYEGAIGPMVFMRIDAEDRPTLAFLSNVDGPHGRPYPEDETTIMLARCLDPACDGVADTTLGIFDGWIDPLGFELTADGRAIAGYWHSPPMPEGAEDLGPEAEPQGHLGLLVCDDASCSTISQTDLGGVYGHIRPALDGSIFLAHSEDGRSVALSRCADPACADPAELVRFRSETMGHVVSFDLDAGGSPVVARKLWLEDRHEVLEILRCADPDCSAYEVLRLDLSEHVGPMAEGQVVFDTTGRPVVVYTEPILAVATCATTDCAEVTYNEIARAQGPGTIEYALTEDDRLVLAVRATDETMENYRVDLVVCDDPACATGTIATLTDHGTMSTATVLDERGNPVVAFIYWSQGEVHLHRCTDPRCEEGALAFTPFEAGTDTQTREAIGPPAERWRPIDAGGGDGWLLEVIRTETEFVAFGNHPCPGGECPVVGTSTDGVTWTWARYGMSGAFMTMTSNGVTTVIGGQRCSGEGEDMHCIPLTLAFEDGTWDLVEVPCDGCAGWIDTLAAWSEGFIAFGVTNDGGGLWLSPDGADWTRVDITGLFGEMERFIAIVDVDGKLRAYGSRCEMIDDWEICDGVLWTSSDGVAWTRDDRLTGLDGVMTWGIDEAPFGYILKGLLCPEPWVCESSLIVSDDGLAWRNIHPDDAPAEFMRVTGFGDGAFAFGGLLDEYYGEEVQFVAQSTDLETWQYFEITDEGWGGVNDLAASDDLVVAVGVDGENQLGVWTWEP